MRWDEAAKRQSGMIRRGQLILLGYTSARVDGLVADRLLAPTRFTGVYRSAGAPHTEDAETWAVVLGTRSVLSYLSAARWWELPVEGDGRVHVTRPDRQAFRSKAKVRIHRTVLDPRVVTTRQGLQVTDRRETLLDCLGWLRLADARTLLDRAIQQHWLDLSAIDRRLTEQPGRWGNRQLSLMRRQSVPGAEAESERRVQRILRAGGVEGWRANVPITLDGQRFRLDLAFEAAKVAIEVEGWAFHRSKDRRDRDLAKLNALARHDWALITFSWEHTEDPDYICRSVRTVLQQRSLR